MYLTVAIAALAFCGAVMIFWALFDGLIYSIPRKDTILVVRLEGDSGQVEHTVSSCLRLRAHKGYGHRIVFVDDGMEVEAQLAAELLLRDHPEAVLCASCQLPDYIRWEKETSGAGAD